MNAPLVILVIVAGSLLAIGISGWLLARLAGGPGDGPGD